MIQAGKFKIDGNTVWFRGDSGHKVEFKVFATGMLFEDAVKAYLCQSRENEDLFGKIEAIVETLESQRALPKTVTEVNHDGRSTF